MCGDKSIKAPELKKKVEELRQVVPKTAVSIFETQFNVSYTNIIMGVSKQSNCFSPYRLLVLSDSDDCQSSLCRF